MAEAPAVAVLEPTTTGDSRRLLATRGVRALVDGTVATVLPAYLIARGPRSHRRSARSSPRRSSGRPSSPSLLGLRGGHLDRVRLLRIVGAGDGRRPDWRSVWRRRSPCSSSSPRVGTHQPVGGRREPLPPDRAVAAARHRARRRAAPTCSRATRSSRRSPGRSARWPPVCPRRSPSAPTSPSSSRFQAVFFAYAVAGVVIFFLYRRLRPRPPDRPRRRAPATGCTSRGPSCSVWPGCSASTPSAAASPARRSSCSGCRSVTTCPPRRPAPSSSGAVCSPPAPRCSRRGWPVASG